MTGLTHAELAGITTKDAELTYTPGGLAILEINLAGSTRITTDEGEQKDIAWYHRAKTFGRFAEAIADSLPAGTPTYILGRLEHRQWTNKSGEKRSAVDVIADTVKTLTPPPDERTTTDAKGQARLLEATNRVVLMGNLTRDAQLRYTPNAHAVCNLSVAVNIKRKDKDDKVGFFDVTAWRGLAERIAEASKGDPVVVTGRLVTDRWTDREGTNRYTTKVDADTIETVARPNQAPARQQAAAPAQEATGDKPPFQPTNTRLDIDEEFPPEEDLPF